MELQKRRVDAGQLCVLRGGWTLTRIAKRCKNERVDAFRGRWTLIGIAKKRRLMY